ncbi:hypothetical protein J6590_044557 [Homalodisca vitripennis]|nr:hypothetical protein J6590_044557 [Homalodisca vitripennis]
MPVQEHWQGAGHSVLVSVVSLGRLAAPVPLTTLTGTLPKVGELASHGETGRTENSQNTVSFSERVWTAPNSSQSQCRQGQPADLNQAENQYSDGVTPPPTDKSGRAPAQHYNKHGWGNPTKYQCNICLVTLPVQCQLKV